MAHVFGKSRPGRWRDAEGFLRLHLMVPISLFASIISLLPSKFSLPTQIDAGIGEAKTLENQSSLVAGISARLGMRHFALDFTDDIIMATCTTANDSIQPFHIQDLAPEIRLLIWEAYFRAGVRRLRLSPCRPSRYLVEPSLLLVSKGVRQEALKPYVARLQSEVADVRQQMAATERSSEMGMDEPGVLSLEMTELVLEEERLQVEVRRLGSEVKRNSTWNAGENGNDWQDEVPGRPVIF